MRIAFVSSAVPRRCGIATFTADLRAAIVAADPTVHCRAAAIDEPDSVRKYATDVHWRIRQGDASSYAAAAQAISRSSADIVNLQHEFGLFGLWHDGAYEDHLRVFLEHCTKPVVTTLHTVPPEPAPWMQDVVRAASERSDAIVVMATTAARLLREMYGIAKPPVVIEHGMPAIEPKDRGRLKRQFALEDRQILCTFGLVDPRKGLEYVIQAMPMILARHPSALYLIVGQTHPELVRREGERYRESLVETAGRLGVSGRVRFVNEYLTQRQIVEYLQATDVYVTPYLDPNQITSGTLSYALGAGKAIVSTPYLHALEALADDRGVLVPFRDARAIGAAVSSILDQPTLRQTLEAHAYEYGRTKTWPVIGSRVLALMRQVLKDREAVTAA